MRQVLALALALSSLAPAHRAEGDAYCLHDVRLTAYVRTEHGRYTYDGTDITTPEPIAAASWDIPMGSVVVVPEFGAYRVADRGGGLGSYRWIDIAVWSRAEAYAITSWPRFACIYPPADGG